MIPYINKKDSKFEILGENMDNYGLTKKYKPDPQSTKLSLALNLFIAVLLLAFVGLIAAHFMKNSSQMTKIKAPPGQEIIYPKDGPPRLAPKS
jgi:hypothetical protein